MSKPFSGLNKPESTNDTVDAPKADDGGQNLSELLAPELTNFYTCLPIQRYHIGRFEFSGGYLSLSAADGEEFEALIASQPIQEQARLRKLPGAPVLANSGVSMVQGIDHSGNTVAPPSAVQQA